MLNQRDIECAESFIRFVTSKCSCGWMFRGQSDSEWELAPKIDRPQFLQAVEKKGRLTLERTLLEEFKRWAPPFLDYSPLHDWDWLAIAQHHGLPTRFLDWTYKPLVSLYFAVEDCRYDDCDSAVWCCKYDRDVRPSESDPFQLGEVEHFVPRHVDQRVTAQGGCFTVHPERRDIANVRELFKLCLPRASRPAIRQVLYSLGVHRASIFPGLDGIADNLSRRESGFYSAKSRVELG